MLGLGAYDSSSEEEVEAKTPAPQHKKQALDGSQANQIKDLNAIEDTPSQIGPSTNNKVPNGPVLGPASMNTTSDPDERSPDPAANAKFEHFLSLKKQGVHFNAKLASSSSLKNPSLLIKMMEHAGIDEQTQYNTSLPVEVWNTYTLPPWAFKEELLRAQQEARQRMDDKKTSGQRSSIEFVPSSPTQQFAPSTETKRKGNP
ncbi:hypothetical protein N7513_010015 [Penicillium frequentans]|nr:hypothetical protein N7513_010015 [Penicillium glabrum]